MKASRWLPASVWAVVLTASAGFFTYRVEANAPSCGGSLAAGCCCLVRVPGCGCTGREAARLAPDDDLSRVEGSESRYPSCRWVPGEPADFDPDSGHRTTDRRAGWGMGGLAARAEPGATAARSRAAGAGPVDPHWCSLERGTVVLRN